MLRILSKREESVTEQERTEDMGTGTDDVKGKAKQVAGEVTGDKDLESRGKSERAVAEVGQRVDQARSKVEEIVGEAADKLKGALHRT
jgi:uncharacterized protein YjbJ (UPF0337 family)